MLQNFSANFYNDEWKVSVIISSIVKQLLLTKFAKIGTKIVMKAKPLINYVLSKPTIESKLIIYGLD